MRVPTMEGVVERRLLINYRIDPDVAARFIPAPFKPQIVRGYAVGGICLIRLGHLRPRGLPRWAGVRTENAAHRFAVQWQDDSGDHTGVYIPQRHSASMTTTMAGGRLFPGAHQRARFTVSESVGQIAVICASRSGAPLVDAAVALADDVVGSTLFDNIDEASHFFRKDPAGYSPSTDERRLDGIELRTDHWSIDPARILRLRSSFFDDPSLFPAGAIEVDSAFVMRHVPVSWHDVGTIPSAARAPSQQREFVGAQRG